MEFTQAGMQVMPMDEQRQNTVLAGFSMFEIRGFIGEHKNRQSVGMYNVTTRMDTSSGRPRPITQWLRDNQSVCRIESKANGVGVGYIPDDPWWYNRVKLLSLEKVYTITGLHTSKGVVPGDVVKKQLNLLRNRLMHETVAYRILRDGVGVSDRDTKAQAEKEMNSFKMVQIQTDATTGKQVPVNIDTSEYEIIEIKAMAFRPEIVELVKKYKGSEFGWTDSLEFREIRKEVIAQFNEIETLPQVQATPEASLKDALSSLSKEEKIALLKNILSDDEPKDTKKKSKAKPEEVEV
jgi:glutaredoxin-related protein